MRYAYVYICNYYSQKGNPKLVFYYAASLLVVSLLQLSAERMLHRMVCLGYSICINCKSQDKLVQYFLYLFFSISYTLRSLLGSRVWMIHDTCHVNKKKIPFVSLLTSTQKYVSVPTSVFGIADDNSMRGIIVLAQVWYAKCFIEYSAQIHQSRQTDRMSISTHFFIATSTVSVTDVKYRP